MDVDAFCDEVEAKVKKDYGYDDGGDLCYNFIETGQVKVSEGVFKAAQTVAMAMAQA